MLKSVKLRVLDCKGDFSRESSDLLDREDVPVVPRAGLEVILLVLHTSCGYPRVGYVRNWATAANKPRFNLRCLCCGLDRRGRREKSIAEGPTLRCMAAWSGKKCSMRYMDRTRGYGMRRGGGLGGCDAKVSAVDDWTAECDGTRLVEGRDGLDV